MDALVQEILIELLSDSVPSRGRGAGVLAIADNFAFNSFAFVGEIRQAVSTAQSHILANQRGSTTLSNEERLSSLLFLSASQPNGEWTLSLRVTNGANQTRDIAVPVGS
jgi:hypothetical protein